MHLPHISYNFLSFTILPKCKDNQRFWGVDDVFLRAGIDNIYFRIYVVINGVREEIGDGYSVGPGHGLIVSKIGENFRVNLLQFVKSLSESAL